MSERKLTLLELHFHNHGDVQVGPETVTTGGRESLRSRLRPGGRSTEEASGADGRRSALSIPFAAGGVALLALATVTWRVLRSR